MHTAVIDLLWRQREQLRTEASTAAEPRLELDRTERGRKLRMLVVIDEFTRESLAIEVAWSFTAERVIEVLQYVFAVRGAPDHIRSDNGPEFVAQAVTRWLDRAGVKTLFIAKGSPWENGYVESFNSRLRDELLDRELFLGLADAAQQSLNQRSSHSGWYIDRGKPRQSSRANR